MTAVAVASVALNEIASGMIPRAGGCGFDGAQYCAMALGHLAAGPFNDRILLPMLVRLTHPLTAAVVVSRFAILDVVSFLAVMAGVAVMTMRVAGVLGATPGRRLSAALLAVALIAAAPMAFHLVRYYPVLTDPGAIAIGTWWIVLLTSRNPRLQLLSVPLAALAILGREAWAPAVLVSPGVVLAFRRSGVASAVWVLTAVAGALATWIVLHQPDNGTTQPLLALIRYDMHLDFGSGMWGLSRFAWMTAFGLGFVPLLILRRARRSGRAVLAGRDPEAKALIAALVTATCCLAVVGGLSGWDLQREFFALAPFLFPLAAAVAASYPELDIEVALLCAASLLMWRPFQVVPSTTTALFAYFFPEYYGTAAQPEPHLFPVIASQDALLVAAPLALWVCVALYRAIRPRAVQAALPLSTAPHKYDDVI